MQASIWRRINMGRDHRWAGPRMSEYIDGELAPRQARRLAGHTEICPDCHRVLQTLREMIAAIGRSPAPHPPPAERVADEVRSRLERGDPA